MALHTGEAQERDGNYFGPPTNRAARLLGVAAGGQIVVSRATADVIGHHPQAELVDIGEHRLRGVPQPMRVFLVAAPGLDSDDAVLAPTRPSHRMVWTRHSTLVVRSSASATRCLPHPCRADRCRDRRPRLAGGTGRRAPRVGTDPPLSG